MFEDDEDFRALKETLYEEMRDRVLSDFLAERGSNLRDEIEEDIRPAIRERVFKEERQNVLKSQEMVNFVIRRFFDNPSTHPSLEKAKITFHDEIIKYLMSDEEYMMEIYQDIKGVVFRKQYQDEIRRYLLPECKKDLMKELRSDEKYMEMLREESKEEVKQELIAYMKNEL